jgi:glycosyltransferase involved in cell wall biosynthesis
MHLLHIVSGKTLFPQARQAIQLMPELAGRGIRLSLLCEPDCVVSIAAQSSGVNVVHWDGEQESWLGRLMQTRQLICQLKPDLVHVHCERGDGFIFGLAARLAGVKAVLSTDSPRRINRLPRMLNHHVYNRYLSPYEFVGSRLLRRGLPDAKLSRVRLGIDPDACRPSWTLEKFRKVFGLEADQFVIGLHTDFSSMQEQRYLLHLLPLLTGAYAGVRVIVFGEGPLEGSLEKNLQVVDPKGVVQLARTGHNLKNLLGHLQIFLSLSTQVRPHLELLDAQASGVPIAGINNQATLELVAKDNRINLVSPKDNEGLATAIKRLIYQPRQRRQLKATGERWVRQEFATADMAASYLEAYARTLRNRSNSSQASCEIA